MNKLTLSAAAASLLLLGASAASAVDLPFPTMSGNVIDLDPINSTQTFSVGTAVGGDGYYYTFTTLGTYALELTDSGSNHAVAVANPFTVFAGTDAARGATEVNSTAGIVSEYAFVTLPAGTYTLLVPNSAANGEALSGVVSAGAAAVPEPASWALMMIGVAGVGGFMRRRSSMLANSAI